MDAARPARSPRTTRALPRQPLPHEIDRTLVVPSTVDVAPEPAVECAIVQPSQPTALANGQFADEGHVVHATEHAAISGLCDDQGLAPQIAEGARRTTLLSQVTADQRW